ncbi:far upstream element-binding protein [Grosmannia clavigera kw1407]|uniref:Far upstream element-binding protein n=1 Tax=Grosmannia clavigera (strain kw1407 / UAMH 11150) TaxID=655863 RepID=F0XV39_GROCL|nr:far upstream element-binding protein [Grosmannia clavigera kw1407]EFW98744.1 far upstream element-binding protein [Grosmannia clavigera kw1407]
MSEFSNLESILATLAAQKPQASSTPPQSQQPSYPPPAPSYPAHSQAPGVSSSAPYQAAPAASYQYPQPTSSGSLDLGAAVQPTTSGNVSIQEAIARAKAHAAQNGVTPYDRPITYSATPPATAQPDARRYRSSRSRSPAPARRTGDSYRNGSNPYRDERRDASHDHGDERSFSPTPRGRDHDRFSPRGGNGGRHRSPGRGGAGGGAGAGGDDITETIEIPASLVGLIIGRQGENLKRVENDSHCRVQFLAAASPDEETRQCKITGPGAQRVIARTAIYQIIEDSGMSSAPRGTGSDRGASSVGGRGAGGAGMGAAGGGGTTPLKDGEECVQIMVPDRTVGLIIGRGGETIRDLQERSGCHINIVGEAKSVNGLRPVNLIGARAMTNQAKELIMEIVDSDTRNSNGGGPGGPGGAGGPSSAPFRGAGGGGREGFGGAPGGGGAGFRGGPGGGGGGDRINDSIFVPSEAVGMIIGKGGETIREMQTQTGCKINVSQTPGANENEREIGLIGSLQAIEMAKLAIEEKVEAVRAMSGSDDPNADPYAPYGGYAAYVAMWYQALQQQQAGGAPGDGA